MDSLPNQPSDDRSKQQDQGFQPDETFSYEQPSPKEQKEILTQLDRAKEKEKAPVYEYKEPEVSPEVEGWLEKLEKGEEIRLPQPVTDDQGQVVLDDSTPQEPKIVLPLTKEEMERGLHKKVWESMRWLAEWCKRLIKKASGRVFYKEATAVAEGR